MGRSYRVIRDLRAEEGVRRIISYLGVKYIRPNNIRVVRSYSDAKVYARIWGICKVVQVGLGIEPTYVIEIVDNRFKELNCRDKIDVILHELAHIPRTFSGYVRQHGRAFMRDLNTFRMKIKDLSSSEVYGLCEYF